MNSNRFLKFTNLDGKPLYMDMDTCQVHGIEAFGNTNYSVILWSPIGGQNGEIRHNVVDMQVDKCMEYITQNWNLNRVEGRQEVRQDNLQGRKVA